MHVTHRQTHRETNNKQIENYSCRYDTYSIWETVHVGQLLESAYPCNTYIGHRTRIKIYVAHGPMRENNQYIL